MSLDVSQISDYVEKNKVPVKLGTVCVDGRYSSKQAGMLARPGGNFKDIMVLLSLRKKLKLTIGQVVDLVVKAVEETKGSFDMHTDEHADPNNLVSIGCGHIGKAENPDTALLYKVDPEDVKKALQYIRIKLEGSKNFNLVRLEGEHQEKAVLVVTGKKYTVNHQDKRRNLMFFVYDQTRDEEYSKRLFKNLKIKGISYDQFKKISDKQLAATLQILAKGMPVFELNADTNNLVIKASGVIS